MDSIRVPSGKDMILMLIFFGCVCGVIGWLFIELLIWCFSHVNIN